MREGGREGGGRDGGREEGGMEGGRKGLSTCRKSTLMYMFKAIAR